MLFVCMCVFEAGSQMCSVVSTEDVLKLLIFLPLSVLESQACYAGLVQCKASCMLGITLTSELHHYLLCIFFFKMVLYAVRLILNS